MATKRRYSITKDKRRINDDFLLRLKIGVIEHNFNEFNSNDDWSFFCYGQLNENGILRLLNTRAIIPLVLQPYGIDFRFDTTKVSFGYLNKISGLIESEFVNYSFSIGEIYSFAFVFDSLTKELSFFVNSRNIGVRVISQPFNLAGEIENILETRVNAGNGDIELLGINCSCRNYIAYSKKTSNSEINYIYQTGTPVNINDTTLFLNLPFNNMPNIQLRKGGIVRKTDSTEDYNGFGAVFNSVLSVGDSFSFETTYDSFSDINFNARWIFGLKNLTDINTPILGDAYLLVTDFSTNIQTFIKTGVSQGTQAISFVKGDVFSLTLTTATTIEVKKNAILQFTLTGVDSTSLKPFFNLYDSSVSNMKNLSMNGGLMDMGDVITENGTNLLNRNSQDLAYINNPSTVPKEFNYIDYSGDELGLNAGTSTFAAYGDYYTKVLGQNFTGGGGSITYKSKELRKYGVQLDGTQYLSISNITQFDVNKGITILVGFADINETGTSKEFIHLTDSNSNRVITLEYDDVSTNVLFKSGDITQDTQSIAIDKTVSNFGVYRISANQNKYNNGLFTKSSGINTVDTTRTNEPLNRTDATYNIFVGSGDAGASPMNFTLTYFAIFEGVLNDAEVKRYYNNGIFYNVDDLTETTESTLIAATDLNNPFDDVGVLKYPDLSTNSETIIVNGFANITDLENAKIEILSLI